MPIVTLPVPDTKDSITRPVVSSILNELLLALGMKRDNINVYYPDEAGVMYQHNSTIKEENELASRMPGVESIWIEVDDQYASDAFFQNEHWKEEEPFIFVDEDLRIYMKPTHTACELTINFKYKTLDRTQAERWRNTLRGRMNNYKDLQHHLLKYHYLIPNSMLYILTELHRLREEKHGYGETFSHWLKDKGSPRFTRITNLAGKANNLAIAEQQMNVFGYWDFDLAPEKGSKDSNNETWEISVSYTIRYERPTEITLTYPLMIHNQLLPSTIRPTEDRLSNVQEGTDRLFSLTGFLFNHHGGTWMHDKAHYRRGVVTPRFDEWVAPTSVPRTTRLLQALVQLDDENPREIFRLDDYEGLEYTMDGEVMDFLASEHPWINDPRESVFNVSLYNQFGLMHYSYLKMDKYTNLTATSDLNPRNYYHIRLSLHHDWRDLSENALKRLANNPSVMEKLLKHLGYEDFWSRKSAQDAINEALKRMADTPPFEQPRMRTVQTFSIITYRGEPSEPKDYKKDPYYTQLLNKDGKQLIAEQHRY